jgi:RNase P subunit RPR2
MYYYQNKYPVNFSDEPYSKSNSTTVIVKIKGKLRSLFCNKCTVTGKLMHIIIYNENKYVELICENKDVLVNFTS